MTGSTDDAIAIRRLIEDWASAVRARNIGGVLAHHTDDVVMFDVPFEIAELDVTAGDTVAFATALPALRLEGGAHQGQGAAPAPDDRAAQDRWCLEDRPRASLLPA